MEARQITLLGLLSGEDKRFIIPVFQRNYDWKQEHCIQLFRDIENVYLNSNRKSHFLGTIVYISNSEVDMIDFHEYVLIDGQQRITTIILLLKALYDELVDKDDIQSRKLSSKIFDFYLTNKYADESQKLRLRPMVDDDKVFQGIMRNDFDFIDNNSNMYKNYILFNRLIEKSRLTVSEIYNGVKKLMVVYIGLKRGEDEPQLIFESLNSTGLNLSQADLIRNFILMDREPKEQEKFYNCYWYKIEKLLGNENISDFVRDYLTMKQHDIPKKSEIYIQFKKYVNQTYGLEHIEKLLIDLLYYSKIYYKLITDFETDQRIREIIIDLRRLKVTVSYPFLMEVYSDYEQSIISRDTLIKVFELIETYIFRRLICDNPTNALNKVFKNLAKELKKTKNYKEKYYENLVSILLNKKYSASFPIDSEFKQEFLTRNMYKFKHIRYLLDHLENYNNNEKVDVDVLTIEHIMPQKLDAKWTLKLGNNAQSIHEKYLHNIGNLTLTGYNSSLSNKSFDDKKIILENSKLQLNKGIGKLQSWNEIEIEKRALELFDIANKYWSMPALDKIVVADKDILNKESFDLSDEIDVTGRKPIAFEILGEKHSVNSWKKFIKELSKILFKLDNKLFYSFINDNDFSGRKTRIIAKDTNMRTPIKISENIYVETNLNANSTLNYIKLMIEKYGLNEDDLIYWIR